MNNKSYFYLLFFLTLTSCTLKTPLLTCKIGIPSVAYVVRANPYYTKKDGKDNREEIVFATVAGVCK